MKPRRAAAAVCLLAVGPVALAESRAAEVAAWLTGTFEAKDPAADGGSIRIVIVSVPKSRIANGAAVLYREQAVAPKLDEPSLQRFYRLEEDGEVVRLRAFDPRDPLIVRGKWRDPSALALYGANDVREKPGCEIALKRTGARWEGGTPETTPQAAACPSHLRNAVRMTSLVTLSKDELMQWDRGFDEKGKQTWGSLEGGTTFVKRSVSAPVDGALQERTVGRRPEVGRGSEAVPAGGGARGEEGFSANGKEVKGAGAAPKGAALELIGPRSPSKRISVTELRDGDSTRVPLRRVFVLLGVETEGMAARRVLAPAVLLVTGRDGYAAVFSVEEALAADGPQLDLAGPPGIVYARSAERSVRDVVSIELKLLAANPKQP